MLNLEISPQPNDETCGPTSLHAIYHYYQDDISLVDVINEVQMVDTGGTIAAFMGQHALRRGYRVSIYAYNLSLFDPTWFHPNPLPDDILIEKLLKQSEYKQAHRFLESTYAYVDFLRMGGKLYFKDLTDTLLKKFFAEKIPVMTGLSATYLYNTPRELVTTTGQCIHDDVRGEPGGHFVVLCGYDKTRRHVVVADPHVGNPIAQGNYYKINISHLINSIMLGVLTYDANLLVIEPSETGRKRVR